jgi:hypothetical protein
MSDPVYKGHWAEIILHGRQAGIYQSVQIDPAVMPCVVQEDYWVSPGEEIERFSGANKAIGTLVLNFPDRETLEKYMSDDSWYQVIVNV